MTTLVTGGSGRTSGSLAKLLQAANRPFIVASRSGEAGSYKATKFDFLDKDTFENPFKIDANIDRVYIVPPPGSLDVMSHLIKFIDFAISKGVKRVVLLSVTLDGPEDIPTHTVHKHLIDTGVDFTVLRPTWFIQNFGSMFVASIKDHNQIFSATGDGRLPFVSTEDVAQAAFEGLTVEKSPNTDILLLGPELLSYPEAAKIVSTVLGREITHKRYSVDELSNLYTQFGLDPAFSHSLASMEGKASMGSEEAFFNSKDVHKFIGKRTLAEFIEDNKALYSK